MTTGRLFVVATPIGNLADSSPRALESLSGAALIACEDTRTSRTLLAKHGIRTPLVALHRHNERRAGETVLATLRAGHDVALISDAGTPGISDPGALLVESAHRGGIRVLPVPGPSAAIAAYSAAGFAADSFLFIGFLPASGKSRRDALDALAGPRPAILYEAPHRIRRTVQDLLARMGGEREIVIARELTKFFEEVARMPLAAAPGWIEANPHREQGEFVVVLGPGTPTATAGEAEQERVLAILLESVSASDAARLAARITGAPRQSLYRKALQRNPGSSS